MKMALAQMTTKASKADRIRAAYAEARIYRVSPSITLAKLRFVGEAIAQKIAYDQKIDLIPTDSQAALIDRLARAGAISLSNAEKLHQIRESGNVAVHQNSATAAEAARLLHAAQELISDLLSPPSEVQERKVRFPRPKTLRQRLQSK